MVESNQNKPAPPALDLYTDEQVQQILKLALTRRSNQGDRLTRQQVNEIATELGVSQADFVAAEQEWLTSQIVDKERVEFDQYQKRHFRDHAIKFGMVNVFLMGLDLLTSGGLDWSLIVLLSWGLGLALDAWSTYQTDSTIYEKRFHKWQRKRHRDRFTTEIKTRVSTVVQDLLKPIEE
ncbi:hypothetical protein Pse7367_2760 [Thalassoporum mexicanum PCC 7367]|uniref:2TM domain-containing protein n=1 Tax=Thalassoporum mexicanum TaxID=3457544 RepID=UPI00029FFF45|nr:2TM domain-containing protein [Pseudanabaena sp. PCC 7367]AFY71015.1 hypothetical protein Pse7367_2760 [Pseudanabaena sp. PCC 7367]